MTFSPVTRLPTALIAIEITGKKIAQLLHKFIVAQGELMLM
ncbi:MAG: hypothetical protein ACI95X_002962 [Paraglaciecola sp.]|jgi:hypothetical protein